MDAFITLKGNFIYFFYFILGFTDYLFISSITQNEPQLKYNYLCIYHAEHFQY
jgi:hypothetical protein